MDEALYGPVRSGTEVLVDLPTPDGALTHLKEDIAQREGVFLLQDKYEEVRSLGLEGAVAEAERGYFMLRDYDGALMNFSGTAYAYFSLADGIEEADYSAHARTSDPQVPALGFGFDKEPFDEVLAAVEEL